MIKVSNILILYALQILEVYLYTVLGRAFGVIAFLLI